MESLFEKLSGYYADGTPVSSVPRHLREIKSIQDHIQRMLNTRRGMLSHMPDYGISDVSGLFRRLPASAQDLLVEIQSAIANYEPRLSNVRVSLGDFDAGQARISFRISAVASGVGRLTMDSNFFASGQTTIDVTGNYG